MVIQWRFGHSCLHRTHSPSSSSRTWIGGHTVPNFKHMGARLSISRPKRAWGCHVTKQHCSRKFRPQIPRPFTLHVILPLCSYSQKIWHKSPEQKAQSLSWNVSMSQAHVENGFNNDETRDLITFLQPMQLFSEHSRIIYHDMILPQCIFQNAKSAHAFTNAKKRTSISRMRSRVRARELSQAFAVHGHERAAAGTRHHSKKCQYRSTPYWCNESDFRRHARTGVRACPIAWAVAGSHLVWPCCFGWRRGHLERVVFLDSKLGKPQPTAGAVPSEPTARAVPGCSRLRAVLEHRADSWPDRKQSRTGVRTCHSRHASSVHQWCNGFCFYWRTLQGSHWEGRDRGRQGLFNRFAANGRGFKETGCRRSPTPVQWRCPDSDQSSCKV